MENSFFHLFILAVHLITFYNVFGCVALDNLNNAIKNLWLSTSVFPAVFFLHQFSVSPK